jgi:hypothetical protein
MEAERRARILKIALMTGEHTLTLGCNPGQPCSGIYIVPDERAGLVEELRSLEPGSPLFTQTEARRRAAELVEASLMDRTRFDTT